nr:gag-protease polyprotein [Ipomoea batatas]
MFEIVYSEIFELTFCLNGGRFQIFFGRTSLGLGFGEEEIAVVSGRRRTSDEDSTERGRARENNGVVSEEPELKEVSCHEDDSQSEDEDDLAKAYKELCINSCKVSKLNRSLLKDVKNLEEENLKLKSSVKILENEIRTKDSSERSLQKELEHLRKQVRMLNMGTDKLKEILRTNGQSLTKIGLGYVEGTTN